MSFIFVIIGASHASHENLSSHLICVRKEADKVVLLKSKDIYKWPTKILIHLVLSSYNLKTIKAIQYSV